MHKYDIQEKQYDFPYHYIPSFITKGDTIVGITKGMSLGWGAMYLARQRFLLDRLMENNVKSIIEVGCGDGHICNTLSRFGNFERIKGIDISEKAINWAKMFTPEVEFVAMDVADEAEKWDAVVCSEVLEHISDSELDKFINSLANCLNENGRIYLTVPSVNLPLEDKHYRHYDIRLLEDEICDSGAPIVIKRFNYIIPKRGALYKLVQKPFYNSKWKFSFFDNFEWWLLWRNGLIETEDIGLGLYAECVLGGGYF